MAISSRPRDGMCLRFNLVISVLMFFRYVTTSSRLLRLLLLLCFGYTMVAATEEILNRYDYLATLQDQGTSSGAFFAMLNYVRRNGPEFVLLENVFNASGCLHT